MIRRWTTKRPARRSTRRLVAEALESRRVLAGNLTMVSAQFVDSDRAPLGTPTIGEQIFLEAIWTTTNLNSNDQYVVRFADSTAGQSDIVIDSATFIGTPGIGLTFTTFTGGWYATPGQHHIEVTVDATGTVDETTEQDNRYVINFEPLLPTLPTKLIQPLSGEQNVDWAIVNYPDLSPINGESRDYFCDDIGLPPSRTCGAFTYDGSRGTDYQLANFAAMDRGQPVYAVLGGTVTPGVTGEVVNGIKAFDTMATLSQLLGDINGDTLPDYLFTGPTAAVGNANQVGEAYILYGQPGGFISPVELSDLLTLSGGDGSKGFVVRGLAAGDQTTAAISTGDFNADGRLDLIFGAPFSDPVGNNSGRVYVLYGRDTGFPAEVDLRSLLAINGGDGSLGVVFNGAVSGDNAGQAVSLVGDMNGDGFRDLAIGAPRASGPNFLFRQGQTFVIYGGPGPWPAEFSLGSLRTANGGNGTRGFMVYGSTNFEASGAGLSSAGDLNGDGVEDLAIGAPGFGFGATGDIYVLYGKSAADQLADPFPAEYGLENLLTVNLGDGTKGFVIHGAAGTGIGRVIKPLPDLNGDGLGELGIGATAGGSNSEGQIYLLRAATANFPAEFELDDLLVTSGADGSQGTVITGGSAGALVGTSFAVVGDMNGDTLPELLIGSPGDNLAQLLYGVANGWGAEVNLTNLGLFGGPAGVTFTGINNNDRAGQSVASAGDLNGDGRADILIGASQADPNGFNSGQAYIIYGQEAPFRRTVELSLLTGSRAGILTIDHGNGWISRYEHLDPATLTVRPGDIVEQGEVLGLVGARADGAALLHFELEHNKALVEANLAPTAYWVTPVPYQGITSQQVLDAGITNLPIVADLREHPSDIRYLHPTYTGPLYFWARISHLNPRDEYQINWHLPNGAVIEGPYHCLDPKTSPIFGSACDLTDSSPMHMEFVSQSLELNWRQFTGEWYASLTINGQERARVYFSLVSAPIQPEIRLTYGTQIVDNPIIIDGRTTPIDFGIVDQSSERPSQTFTIENHGSTALHVADVVVPEGFRLAGSFPSLINPRESGQFVIEMETNLAGPQFGAVRVLSDDADEGDLLFYVSGTVDGTFATGQPRLSLPGPAAFYLWGDAPVQLDPQANVFDADSPIFTGGQLIVALVGNVADDDRLAIRDQGTGSGQVSVSGGDVLYEGTIVGAFNGGNGATPLRVTFNSQATLAAVRAVATQVTYASVSLDPGTAAKFARYTLVDDDGHVSSHPVKVILPAPSLINELPVVASLDVAPTDLTQPAPFVVTANGVADADGFVAAVEFYVESNHLVGLQTGPGGDRLLATDTTIGDGWSAEIPSQLLSPGTRTLYAQPIDDRLARGEPVSNSLVVRPPNQPPEIVFLAANPPGAIQPTPINLTANGVSDPDGVVARVDFYVESNSSPGLQIGAGGDTLIGSDTSVLGGWTATLATATLADGLYGVYAQAVDTLGGLSVPATLSVQVGEPPPPGSIFLLSDLLSAQGGNGDEGWIISGITAGDSLGRSVSGLGDLNGDGFDDYALGAPGLNAANPARADSGGVYVIFGTPFPTGAEIDLSLLTGANGFLIQGLRAGDETGISVAAAGDVNGDGFGDLILGGAAADPASGANAGEAYVVFGKAAGFPAVLELSTLNGANGFRMSGLAAGDLLGASVAGAGDVNGDGYADLLIGASGASPGSPQRAQAGQSYLVFGSGLGFPATINLGALTGANGIALNGQTTAGRFGLSAQAAGDINGDGYADLVVGAGDGPAGNGPNRGAAYVIFGHGGTWVSPLELGALDGSNGFRVDGIGAGDRFAWSVSGAGDLNGDGLADVVFGAPEATPGNPARASAGVAYVLFGKAGGFADSFDLLTLDGANGFIFEGLSAGDRLGASVAAAGDLNSDGFDDVIVGADTASPGNPARTAAGILYVVYGRSGSFPGTFTPATLNGVTGFRLEGIAAGDHAGSSVAGGFDANGDGFDDLLVGALSASPGDPTRVTAGQAYVFLGRNFTSSVQQVGDENANLLTGDPAANAIVGGANHDTISGMGGLDVLRGGQGNDILGVADSQFRRIDGGRGLDTLRIDGSGIILNLPALVNSGRVSQIEAIDLTGSGANELALDLRSVLNASDTSQQLLVKRNSGDVVTIGSGWALTALQTIDGVTYNVFQQDAATLLLAAVPEGTPWQNPANPLDTSNDGEIAPNDALAVINYLNANPGSGDALPNPPIPGFAPPPLGTNPFLDVNGDGFASAIDALLVINFLNATSGGEGEGEGGDELAAIDSRAAPGWVVVSAAEPSTAIAFDPLSLVSPPNSSSLRSVDALRDAALAAWIDSDSLDSSLNEPSDDEVDDDSWDELLDACVLNWND